MGAVSLRTIVVLLFLVVSLNAEDPFDCTGYADDSFHPIFDAHDCRYYWHCVYVDTVYMRAVRRRCPAGTEFDIHLRQCEIASLVNCQPVTSTQTTKERTSQPSLSTSQTTTEPATSVRNTLRTNGPHPLATAIGRRRRRENPILYILTRDERKIQPFPLNQTHGLLMHCNQIRRRHLRDLIYSTIQPKARVSSAGIHRFRRFFTLVSTLILIFTKISD